MPIQSTAVAYADLGAGLGVKNEEYKGGFYIFNIKILFHTLIFLAKHRPYLK